MSPFIRPRSVDAPAVRLVVFHHAGGSASAYFPLVRGLPADWDLVLLDLPGRGKRHKSPPLTEMAALVALATEDVLAWAGAPLALFGHSFGAVLASEVARSLPARGVRPAWVGVSGRSAPDHRVAEDHTLPEFTDSELLRRLTEMGGMPERIDELPEFRDRLIALVRADLRAVASYRPDPGRLPIAAPLTAFVSTDDAWAPLAEIGAWARETTGEFRQRVFSGGHFHFLGESFATFTAALVHEIRRSMRLSSYAGTEPPVTTLSTSQR